MVISGKKLLGIFALIVAVIGVSSFVYLKRASRLRFAVGVHPIPDEGQRRLPLDLPFVVQIEKRTAGRTKLQAVSLLLDGNGQRLWPPQPLKIDHEPDGKMAETATYPPLQEILRAGGITRLPPQGLVGAIVLRLPSLTPEVLAKVDQAVGRGGPLHLVYGRIQRLCSSLDGNAEMVSKEIRQPDPAR